MSQDKTFRILSRSPYDEVYQALIDNPNHGIKWAHEWMPNVLKDHGWTLYEFNEYTSIRESQSRSE